MHCYRSLNGVHSGSAVTEATCLNSSPGESVDTDVGTKPQEHQRHSPYREVMHNELNCCAVQLAASLPQTWCWCCLCNQSVSETVPHGVMLQRELGRRVRPLVRQMNSHRPRAVFNVVESECPKVGYIRQESKIEQQLWRWAHTSQLYIFTCIHSCSQIMKHLSGTAIRPLVCMPVCEFLCVLSINLFMDRVERQSISTKPKLSGTLITITNAVAGRTSCSSSCPFLAIYFVHQCHKRVHIR